MCVCKCQNLDGFKRMPSNSVSCMQGWILVLRLFNGVALATLSPTTQTLIADLAPPQERAAAEPSEQP